MRRERAGCQEDKKVDQLINRMELIFQFDWMGGRVGPGLRLTLSQMLNDT